MADSDRAKAVGVRTCEARGCIVQRPVARFEVGSGQTAVDWVAVEAPLQICLCGEPLLTTMRTPGRDQELALGTLFSEGIIARAADVGRIYHCGRPTDPGYGNVLDVLPGPGFAFDPERVRAARRGAHAGCGVCGREAIDDLLARVGHRVAAGDPGVISAHQLQRAHDALRAHQPNFDATGGTHAAAAISADGELLAHAEDVGRHNAVDKVLGQLLRADGEPRHRVLAVSGRAGFELALKAILGGFAVFSSVSAPSSMAIDLAEAAGLCLVGFVRDGRHSVYAHAERLA